jgi:hypothetical protein
MTKQQLEVLLAKKQRQLAVRDAAEELPTAVYNERMEFETTELEVDIELLTRLVRFEDEVLKK